MSSKFSELPTVDREFLKRYDELDEPGRPRLVDEIINRFLDSAPELTGKLQLAVERRNSEFLRRAAHALVGTGGNVGAKRLCKIALTLELLGEASSWEGVSPLVDDLLQELEGVKAEFRNR